MLTFKGAHTGGVTGTCLRRVEHVLSLVCKKNTTPSEALITLLLISYNGDACGIYSIV